MKRAIFFLLAFFVSLAFTGQAQGPFKHSSVLAHGEFYQLKTSEDGLYKIDHAFLSRAGIDASSIDLQRVGLFGSRTGMLPQPNEKLLVDDLQEVPLYFEGGDDGSFDEGDYFLFYGQGPHKTFYNDVRRSLEREFHLYDSVNFYYLTLDQGTGVKITERASLSRSIGVVSIFDDFIFHETEQFNVVHSGRYWFGEKIESGENIRFTYPVQGIVPHKTIQVTGHFMSTATSESRVYTSINDIPIGAIDIRAIPQTIYGIKGQLAVAEHRVRVDDLENPNQLALSFEYDNENEGTGYIDKFSLRIPKFIQLYGNQTHFQSMTSLNYGSTAFFIREADEALRVWDVTDPLYPVEQQFTLQDNNRAVFRVTTDTLRRFVLFKGTNFPHPEFIRPVENQDLHAFAPADGLIITPAELAEEAGRLADFRREFNGLDVHVVTLDKIYNEFSGGRQDVTAIRNFIRMMYLKDQRLSYVLLFGDASYSYRQPGTLVPTYQSVNSLHNVHSYASDDYYGFMDSHEGEWSERTSGSTVSHDMEIAIGRLPVNDPTGAKELVDKIIGYESTREGLGDWRNRVAFIADDGESNKFQLQSDFLASDLEQTQPTFNPDRIFVDAFPQDGGLSPVTGEINDQIQNGVLIMDFIGHGGETSWTNEGILRSPDILEWANEDKLPVFLTATCEFGRFDDPNRSSGAELAILHPKGGAIGMFTTTRPVFLGTNFELSQAFYQNLAELLETGQPVHLGDIIRETKNDSEEGVVNRNFSLLGDPFTLLAYPKEEIVLTGIQKVRNTTGDSIFNPLDRIVVTGEIRKNGEPDPGFDGTLEIKILDKPMALKTLGEEGPGSVMEYYNRENLLFKGKSTIAGGRFELEFVLPLDIDTVAGEAKISMYGAHKKELNDATGYDQSMKIGRVAINPIPDDTPPMIRAYLEDESFQLGDLVASDPRLFVELSDESGINLSTRNGRRIRAVLDFESEIDLTPFYLADLDRFDRGQVIYDFNGLATGKHHLAIEAYDTYNNRSVTEIDFFVVDSAQVVLTELVYFPNPSPECIKFSIKHKNNPGAAKMRFSLFTNDGKHAKELEQELVYTSEQEEYNTQFEVCKSSNGSLIQDGLYYFIFEISPGESRKNRQIGRIIFTQ